MLAQLDNNVGEGWRGFREKVNQRPGLVIAVVAVVVLFFVWVGFTASSNHPRARVKAGQFFSADDGATWFVDETQELPPVDHGGRPAYRAFVVTNDDGKTRWVSYLERLSDDAKAKMEELRAQGDSADPDVWASTLKAGWEVKKPGQDKWVKLSDLKEAAKVTEPVAPNGGSGTISPVAP